MVRNSRLPAQQQVQTQPTRTPTAAYRCPWAYRPRRPSTRWCPWPSTLRPRTTRWQWMWLVSTCRVHQVTTTTSRGRLHHHPYQAPPQHYTKPEACGERELSGAHEHAAHTTYNKPGTSRCARACTEVANEEPHKTWEPVAMQTASCAGKVYVVGSQDRERVCRDCGEARSGPEEAHSQCVSPVQSTRRFTPASYRCK